MIQSANQRRHPRVAVADDAPEVTVHVQLPDGLDTRHVKGHDMSRTGLSFIDKAPVAGGTRCTVLLTHLRRPLRIVGVVTNCRSLGERGHLIGVKFTSITPLPAEAPAADLTDDPSVGKLLINP